MNRIQYIGSKGMKQQYRCNSCYTEFTVNITHHNIILMPGIRYDDGFCLVCIALSKVPTPKLTQQQMNNKKQELKERLKR